MIRTPAVLSLGPTVVVPAITAGGLTWWLVRRVGRGDTSAVVAGLTFAAVLYLAVDGAQVAKAPFPAKAGGPKQRASRAIISIPQSGIERVTVGGSEQNLGAASCG